MLSARSGLAPHVLPTTGELRKKQDGKSRRFKIKKITRRQSIVHLMLGTGFYGKLFLLHFYTSTHFLLALWKDLTELNQEYVLLLKESIFW